MHRSLAISILSIAVMMVSCKQKFQSRNQQLFKDVQVGRILILNTFASTDSAIKSVAYFSEDIEAISDDRGGGSSGDSFLNRHRGWSIHLKEEVSVESKAKLIDFLNSLADVYSTIETMNYGEGVDNFEYKYSVVDSGSRIDVKAEAEYRTSKTNN